MQKALIFALPAVLLGACSQSSGTSTSSGGGGQGGQGDQGIITTTSSSSGSGGHGAGPPATGTSCEDAIDITAHVASGTPISAAATGPETPPASECSDSPGSKVYFKFTIGKKANYKIESSFADAIVVRQVCDAEPNVTCFSSIANKLTLTPGEYYVIADGVYPDVPVSLQIQRSLLCYADSDCVEPELPACDINLLHYQCVGCTDDTDCPGGTYCQTVSQTCSSCTTDADCAGNAFGTKCISKHCGCNGDGDCIGQSVGCGAANLCVTCAAGFSDCDLNPINGCESSPINDGLNCGACGVSCNGGGCQTSTCTAPPTAAFPGISVGMFAIDGDTIHFQDATTGDIVSMPLAGGAPMMEAPGVGPISAIAVDATRVFYATMNGVASVLKGGGGAVTYASDTLVYALASDGTSVFWSDALGGKLESAPVGGGSPKVLATVGQVPNLAVDATYVYAINEDGLIRVPKGGGAVTSLWASSGNNCHVLWLDGTYAYTADYDGILGVPLDGGIPFQRYELEANQMNWCISGLTGDATHLYAYALLDVDTQRHRVFKMTKVWTPDAADTLADDQQIASPDAFAYAGNFGIDGTAAYWLVGGNALMKTPK